MLQVSVFEDHVAEYDMWYDENYHVFQSEVLAIRDQMLKLGENIQGIEVGLGTGRFSQALGIKEGIEPSKNMSDVAIKRGIEVINATAEHNPYKSLSQDFVLFVTICHLDKIKDAFKEAHRVIKRGGSIIVGFLPSDRSVAQSYIDKRRESTFFRHAQFYKVAQVEKLLQDSGFHQFEYNQTLFGDVDNLDSAQSPAKGNSEGSFVVVEAKKK